MFEHIRKDITRYQREGDGGGADFLLLVWRTPGLKALAVYRFGRWLQGGNPLLRVFLPLYWLFAAYYRIAFDITLRQSADIGPGLYIGHFGGIMVDRCRLGQNCAIQQEVRLEPGENGSVGPVIGDCVWIGAHAVIRGEFRVGDRATIGAGCVVGQDVPPHSLLVGNPGQLALRQYDNSGFL